MLDWHPVLTHCSEGSCSCLTAAPRPAKRRHRLPQQPSLSGCKYSLAATCWHFEARKVAHWACVHQDQPAACSHQAIACKHLAFDSAHSLAWQACFDRFLAFEWSFESRHALQPLAWPLNVPTTTSPCPSYLCSPLLDSCSLLIIYSNSNFNLY